MRFATMSAFVLVACLGVTAGDKKETHDWAVYGGTSENDHFSSLAQINRKNVKQLAVAWTFDTEEPGGLQTSPIVVAGVLYGLTPTQKVFALNAATGKLLWKFDSGIKGTQPNRGLAFWSDGKDNRVVVAVMNFVYALDARPARRSRVSETTGGSICARTWGAIRRSNRWI